MANFKTEKDRTFTVKNKKCIKVQAFLVKEK